VAAAKNPPKEIHRASKGGGIPTSTQRKKRALLRGPKCRRKIETERSLQKRVAGNGTPALRPTNQRGGALRRKKKKRREGRGGAGKRPRKTD